jgi:predicted transcriptional regulator
MTPETEAKLNALAERTRRGKDELLEEAVNHLLVYNEWLDRKVASSLVAAEHGNVISNEDVRGWIDRRERPCM